MPHPATEQGGRLRIHRLTAEARATTSRRTCGAASPARPKRLPPKYFYDELGSQLFDAICLLPEYYLTRAEAEIFARHADEIVAAARRRRPRRVTLFELGRGSATKTRRIIEALLAAQNESAPTSPWTSRRRRSKRARARCSATTPSSERRRPTPPTTTRRSRASRESCEDGAPRARPLPRLEHRQLRPRGGARLPAARARARCGAGDALLLGADLKKDAAVLEAAYDDALGVTAAFNLNLLARINRELGADFALRDFRHVALYNERGGPRRDAPREHARADRPRRRARPRSRISARASASTRRTLTSTTSTELSALAAETGFTRARTWLDSGERFSSNLFVAVAKESDK